jgi:hypothetical protein
VPDPILTDPHHKREDYRIFRRMLKWSDRISEDTLARVIETAENDLLDEDGRVRNAARKTIVEIMDKAGKSIVELDRMERLDRGDPTENNRVTIDYGERGRQWTKEGDQ